MEKTILIFDGGQTWCLLEEFVIYENGEVRMNDTLLNDKERDIVVVKGD